MNKILREKIIKEKEIENFILYPYVKTEVRKLGKDFYLVINFRYRYISKVNLWDFCGRNIDNLKKFIGKKLVNIINPNKEKSFEISKILDSDPERIKWIIRYFIDSKYISSEEELKKKIGEIDYNQPLIKSSNGLDFAPQFSALVFNPGDISKDLRSKFREETLLKNKEKKNILLSLVKELQDLLDPNPLSVNYIQLEQPKLIVKTLNGKEEEITNTSKIFSWVWKDFTKENVYLPYEVPEIIKNKNIITFVLIDEEIKDKETIYKQIKHIFTKYNKIVKVDSKLPRFDFRDRKIYFNRRRIKETLDIIRNEIKEIKVKEKNFFAFAIIVGKEKYKESDYYEDLKRQLFELNIISQNILEDTLKRDKQFKYIANNLLIQILSKLGIKYFVLKSESRYDYILGVDIGKHKYEHRIGGCVIIFDSKGWIRKIEPIKIPARGETLDLPRVMEKLVNEIELEGKSILILRDGTIKSQERKKLAEISEIYNIKVNILGLVKTHNHIILTDDLYNIGILLEDFVLFLPHKTDGARPIRIDGKIEVEDLQLLANLTRLNYAVLFSDEKSLKLPAPVHYADKFVKALGKDWKIDYNLLKEGFLYFL